MEYQDLGLRRVGRVVRNAEQDWTHYVAQSWSLDDQGFVEEVEDMVVIV